MLRKKKHNHRWNKKRRIEHNGLYPYLARYLEISKIRSVSPDTLRRRESALRRFIEWCDERGVEAPNVVTKPMLERYQKHLYYYRKQDGAPLSTGSQNVMLTPIRSFFKWLTQENYLLYNPASELVLPKKPKRLPRSILSVEDVMNILAQPNVATPSGVRDRAMLETLYATGIRRSELGRLAHHDIDSSRQTLFVYRGKNDKDRYVPLGRSAFSWVEKYRLEIRPQMVCDHLEQALFLTDYGEPFKGTYLGGLVKRYIKQAGIDRVGSCHLFRHAMATHMLENGADIRFIQAMLGHADLSTTEIYTHVNIEKLAAVHAATHPGLQGDRDAFLAALAAERDQ